MRTSKCKCSHVRQLIDQVMRKCWQHLQMSPDVARVICLSGSPAPVHWNLMSEPGCVLSHYSESPCWSHGCKGQMCDGACPLSERGTYSIGRGPSQRASAEALQSHLPQAVNRRDVTSLGRELLTSLPHPCYAPTLKQATQVVGTNREYFSCGLAGPDVTGAKHSPVC